MRVSCIEGMFSLVIQLCVHKAAVLDFLLDFEMSVGNAQ